MFGLGLITAAAADSHGAVVSAFAKGSTLTGAARSEAVSDVAQTNGKSDTANRGAHGEAVTTVAKSGGTAAHSTGAMAINHGGLVIKTAHKR